ncbi:MAG TPA: two-component regulator propeller domain-containing protein [Bacteroidia bacterium]|nr:two-component regulator propeller domain-containing protein [Bacteroidia bacterium]
MKKKSFIYYCLLFFTFSIPLFAQRNNFQVYSIEQGLPQATIYCITQDHNGYLWLGTEGGGLCRFDGITFKTFSKKEGFSGDIVRSLLLDKKGRLWAGTKDEGLILYDGLKFKNISKKNGLSGTTVLSIVEDEKGNIWAGTDDGGVNKVTELSKDSFRVQIIDEHKGLSNNSVFNIHQDKAGHIWLATFGGLNIITPEKDSFRIDHLRGGKEIPSDLILSISEDNEGTLWFGMLDEGVFSIAPAKQATKKDYWIELLSRKVTLFNHENGFTTKKVWGIFKSSKNEMWFASAENGIIRNRNASLKHPAKFNFEHYTDEEGLPGNQILCVFEDNEKNIWIGTNSEGLCKYMGDRFSHYREDDGLPNNIVQGIDQDSLGNFWLATAGGIVQMNFNKTTPQFKNYTMQDGLLGNNILSVSAGKSSKNPNIWAAIADVGIAKFNGKKISNYSVEHDLLDNSVYSILVDKSGKVWSGTKEGISLYDGVKFLNMNMATLMISDKDVNAIIQDKKGDIWFGTGGGLAKYSGGGEITTYDDAEGLIHENTKSLTESADGNIWIGTNNGGLYMFDAKAEGKIKIKFIADDSLLGSNSIKSLVFQDEKNLIVGTDKGFCKITFGDDWKINSVKSYNATDGFTGVECNDNAIYKDRKNNIWIGTVKGLTCYNPSADKENQNAPQTHITAVKLFYNDVDWKTKTDSVLPWFNLPFNLSLPYSENHLLFQFSAISLDNPQKIKYRYQLEGLEKDWSPITTQTERDYPGLAPGTYTFKVKAMGANGIWNAEPTVFTFTISPPWYRTVWFYIICVILFVVVVYAYIQFREHKLLVEKKILEDKVLERTAEVVKQKEELEQQKEIIEEKNKDITDSINYAKRIQDAILPPIELIQQKLPDTFLLYKPKDIIAGDFYWMEEIDHIIFIAAADCTGHGVPGAMVSVVCSNALNSAVKEFGLRDTGKILDKTRELVLETFKKSGEEIKDGMDISLLAIDEAKQQVLWSGANNQLWYISNNQLHEIKADKQSIGKTDNPKPFTAHTITFKKDDVYYLMTDGYPDQFGGPKGKKFKYKQLEEKLLAISDKPLQEQNTILKNTFNDWKGNLHQVDDVTLIGIKL